jgi:hypothetical protein
VTSAPVATTAPNLTIRAPAEPAPTPTIASEVGPAASGAPRPNARSNGYGSTAVTAWRNVERARYTSWRTAPSDSPIRDATRARGTPCSAVLTRASRCRAGSELSSDRAAWTVARRATSSSSDSPPSASSGSGASIGRCVRLAALRTIECSQPRRCDTSDPALRAAHAFRNACCTTSSARPSGTRRRACASSSGW